MKSRTFGDAAAWVAEHGGSTPETFQLLAYVFDVSVFQARDAVVQCKRRNDCVQEWSRNPCV